MGSLGAKVAFTVTATSDGVTLSYSGLGHTIGTFTSIADALRDVAYIADEWALDDYTVTVADRRS